MHCHHHPTCPGCPLHDKSYADQLSSKRERLARALAAFPHLPAAPDVRPAVRQEGYRHRLKLPVAHLGDGEIAVGLYDRDGETVLDTPDCPVLVEGLRDGMNALRPFLSKHPEIHAVDLRVSDATGDLQLVLAADGGSTRGGVKALHALRREIPAITSLAVSVADPDRKRVMGRRPQLVGGEPFLEERVGETSYRLLPGAFFQADPRNAAALHARVATYVRDAKTILDLYAGVGAYALAFAEGRERVVAVEEIAAAADAARAVAPPNVEVRCGRVETMTFDEPFDLVILNPARRGADPGLLTRLPKLAKRAIYVSCGPETLARDLDILAAHGMVVDRIEAIDLFPQTAEVETIVHLVQGVVRRTFAVPGGKAGGPWHGQPSGAIGKPEVALALVLHDPGFGGRTPTGRWERLGLVAGHALLRFHLDGPLFPSLVALARQGHPTAGRDAKTAPFFAEKGGLVRPFEHVIRASGAVAPLHGDLLLALRALRAPDNLISAALSTPERWLGAEAGGRGDSGGPPRGKPSGDRGPQRGGRGPGPSGAFGGRGPAGRGQGPGPGRGGSRGPR